MIIQRVKSRGGRSANEDGHNSNTVVIQSLKRNVNEIFSRCIIHIIYHFTRGDRVITSKFNFTSS